MCRSRTKNGLLDRASRWISGMAASLSRSALGLRPVFQEPQPEYWMYLLKPRAAELPTKPTLVVLYPALRRTSGSVRTFGVSLPLWRRATHWVLKMSMPVSMQA